MFNYVILLLLAYSGSEALQQCNDCVPLYDCEEVNVLNNSTEDEHVRQKVINTVKNVLCKLDLNDEANKYWICCSKFKSEIGFSIKSRFEEDIFDKLPQKCGDINGDRLVGGYTAKLNEFPWMALIAYGTPDGHQFDCAGSLINQRYVLTAAHCIKPHILGVRLGEYNVYTQNDCSENDNYQQCQKHEDFEIEQTIPHEDYKVICKVNYNDIALIRLKIIVNYRKNIIPICLPATSTLKSYEIQGKNAVVAGWGRTENGQRTQKLRKATLPVLTKTDCYELQNRGYIIKKEITNRICAGKYNVDACNGDSGGPLMTEQSYNGVERMVQYGIVSYGDKVCGSNKFGVYTEVAKYMDWILEKIRP